MLSESKYLADFSVGFLGKKPQTLSIPIYSTTVLYDKHHEWHFKLHNALSLTFEPFSDKYQHNSVPSYSSHTIIINVSYYY